MRTGRLPTGRRPRDVALAWVATGVVVAAVYWAVMLVGRALTGGDTSLGLAILATGAVAAVIGPTQRGSERLAARLLHGTRQDPYDVLRQFGPQVHGEDALTALPARMARLLAEGTASEWAQVWLLVNDRPILVASHPPGAATDHSPPELPHPTSADGTRTVTVAHQGRLLGFLRVQERAGHPLTPVEERLFAGLASQAGLALHAARIRAELEDRHAELAVRTDELRSARGRLVAAQDAARRHLERDIHDGAQQQLVALGVNLRLAQTLAGRDRDRARELLETQAAAAEDALETLVSLARGDRPRALREHGLVAALHAVAAGSPVPVTLDLDDVGALPEDSEAALYFCAVEALQNAAKHAAAAGVQVSLRLDDDVVRLRVSDDGRGVAPTDVPGAGRANMQDRLAAAGGRVEVFRRPEGGTEVSATLPLTAGVAR